MFLRGDNGFRKSRRTIPNVSCFIQSVYNLMMSSRLVAVQCEAAALLVELSAVPQVLEGVERCYLKILAQKNVDDTMKKIAHERLKNVQEKRKSIPKSQKRRQKLVKL